MEHWNNGTTEHWPKSITAQRGNGQWNDGTMIEERNEIMEQWDVETSTTGQCDNGTMKQWNNGTMEQRQQSNNGTVRERDDGTLGQCDHDAI